jgi:hypothetical protein
VFVMGHGRWMRGFTVGVSASRRLVVIGGRGFVDVTRGNRLEIQTDVVEPGNHAAQVLHWVVHRVQCVVGKGRVARMVDYPKVFILAHARCMSYGGATRRPRW